MDEPIGIAGQVTAAILKRALENGRIEPGQHVAVLNVAFVVRTDSLEEAETAASALKDQLKSEHPLDQTLADTGSFITTCEVMEVMKDDEEDEEGPTMADMFSKIAGPLDQVLAHASPPSVEEYFIHLREVVVS